MNLISPALRCTAVLALLLSSTLHTSAANRYDQRPTNPKYEARGDDDEEPAAEADETADAGATDGADAAENASAVAADETSQSEPAPAAVESEPPPEPLPLLPAPERVSVTLGGGCDPATGRVLEAKTEFDVNASEVFAAVTITGDDEIGLNGRIVVEQVDGESAGDEAARAACDEWIGGPRTVALRFPFPESGLAPGRYRLEVQENRPTRRVIALVGFTVKSSPLPEPGSFNAGLHTTEAPGETLGCGEQSVSPPRLFATLESAVPLALRASVALVAEDVEGLPRDRAVATAIGGSLLELSPESSRATVELELSRFGLPAGTYRLEFREVLPPRRLVKSVTFATKEAAETEPFNLADPENGGLLESASGEGGAGLTWAWMTLRPHNTKVWQTNDGRPGAELPAELVLSFYKREPAVVAAVEIVPGDPSAGPHKVEVWGSTTSATDGFQKLAEKSFRPDPDATACRLTIPSSTVRFLKVRFVDTQDEQPAVAVQSLRVIEGRVGAYQSLRERFPELRGWRLQPKHAAQQGLFFLQASGTEFQRRNNCMGCHVQSQALMGLSVARKNEYVVSDAVERELADFTVACATSRGDIGRGPAEGDDPAPDRTNTIFGALGLRYARPDPKTTAELQAAARWLATQQEPEGQVYPDSSHPPVTQGEILQTAHAMDVWAAVLAAGGEPQLKDNLSRALAWMTQAPVETTQDKVFKVLAFVRHGGDAERRFARQLCQQLLAEQGNDGAWRIDATEEGGIPSPFATGQVLYALRQAGFSPNSQSFRRGVQWLLLEQSNDASWKAGDTTSPFASTMWPVIALTGSFSSKAEPARLSVVALPRPVPPPPPPAAPVIVAPTTTLPKNILFVFDCSFSMTEKIRKRAKFDIAKEVLREVINKLPDETKVGLRLYGHRHGSMTNESRADTELVVPIGPLDRTRLIRTIDGAKALGQTPLVLSTLAAGEDLKKAGGGIIVVVTDGEESCGGRPRKAGPQLAELGVPLRLEVIGFALTGRRVADDMIAFTAPTGGRFHTAADGLQLATALKEASRPDAVVAPQPPPPPAPPEPEDLPYEVFDAEGHSVAKSSTLGGEPPELAPGVYRVELRDGAKTASLAGLKLAEGQTLELRYDPATGRIEYAP
ncbi:MAG TPA: VWA domain-containing protein [Opitutaceae bacterium]|nr:VWA domain-containing protein [Opitutaceae bacterium]